MNEINDPEILAFIARTEAFYPADANLAGVADNRRQYDAMCDAFRAPRPEGIVVTDHVLAAEAPDRDIPVRTYRRPERSARSAILYSHGGGFCLGGLNSHDDVCAELCAQTGCEVVAVDYRLAPEHRYPAQLDDVGAVYANLAVDGRPVIVVGDSAGGCLSAALCLRARRLGWRQPLGQILIYPGLGGDIDSLPSYQENAEAPLLRTVDVRAYSTILTGDRPNRELGDPELTPLSAGDLSGLAPALVISADIDPLRDDARLYVEKLREAGTPAVWRNEEQLIHGYLRGRLMSRRIAQSFSMICAAIDTMNAHAPSSE